MSNIILTQILAQSPMAYARGVGWG